MEPMVAKRVLQVLIALSMGGFLALFVKELPGMVREIKIIRMSY